MSERHPFDVYETPRLLALRMTEDLATTIAPPAHILCPWAGSGAFVAAARAVWPSAWISACDIRPQSLRDARAAGADLVLPLDWRNAEWVLPPHPDGAAPMVPDLILDNPPWDSLPRDISLALQRVQFGGHVALLLRLSQAWSPAGLEVLALPHRKSVTAAYPRPSYSGTGGSTDMVGSGIYLWERGYEGPVEDRPVVRWRNDPKKQGQLFSEG